MYICMYIDVYICKHMYICTHALVDIMYLYIHISCNMIHTNIYMWIISCYNTYIHICVNQICIYTHRYIYIYIYIYNHICLSMYVYAYKYTRVYVYISICMYTCICIYIYMHAPKEACICIHASMHAWMHPEKHACTHT